MDEIRRAGTYVKTEKGAIRKRDELEKTIRTWQVCSRGGGVPEGKFCQRLAYTPRNGRRSGTKKKAEQKLIGRGVDGVSERLRVISPAWLFRK